MNRQQIRAFVFSTLLVMLIFVNSVIALAATRKPVKLEIVTYPKTVNYTVGDEVVTRGLTLRVTYDDSSSDVISKGYTTSYNFSTAGEKKVTIAYSENGVSLKSEYQVTVYNKPLLKTENTEITPDSYFELPVNISGNCGFMGVDVNVSYDANVLTPISVSKGELITDGLFDDSVATSAAGAFDVIWSGSSEIADNGQLCVIKFYCNKDVEVGKTSVSVSTVRKNTYKENYNTIVFNNVTSEISVIKKVQPVEKKNLSNLVVEMTGWDVSGTKSTPKLSGNLGKGKVTYTYAQINGATYTSTVPSKAGTYIVKAVVEETEEYNAGVATCVFTVTDKNSEPKPTVKKSLKNLSLVMNGWDVSGTPSAPVLTGNDGKGKVTYSYALVGESEYTSVVPSKAGTYIARATVEETEEYSAGITTCIFTITDKSSEPVPVEKKLLANLTLVMAGWDVSGTKSTPVLTGNDGDGKVTYSYALLGTSDYSEAVPDKAGTYVIKAVVEETENFYGGVTTCIFAITDNVKPQPVVKKKQTIITAFGTTVKTYGDKAKSLGAKTTGNGKLTYVSSNKSVVTVSSNGLVSIKGTGKAVVTIKASATTKYNSAVKKITIVVKPKKQQITKLVSQKKNKVKVVWKIDSKASGYEVQVSRDTKFTKVVKRYSINTYKYYAKEMTGFVSGRTYYVRVRSYKLVGKDKIYGAYSVSKSIKVK